MRSRDLIVFLGLCWIGCGAESRSLDCGNATSHVQCQEAQGALCDTTINRCVCSSESTACPCATHSQCQSQVCDFDSAPNLSDTPAVRLGTCVPSKHVVYLNPQAAGDTCVARGDASCPYRILADAYQAACQSDRWFIHLTGVLSDGVNVASRMRNLSFAGRTAAVAACPQKAMTFVGTYDHLMPNFRPQGTDQHSRIDTGISLALLDYPDAFQWRFDGIEITGRIKVEGQLGTSARPKVVIRRSAIVQNTADTEVIRLDRSDIDISGSAIRANSGFSAIWSTPSDNAIYLASNAIILNPTTGTFSATNGILFYDLSAPRTLLYNSILSVAPVSGKYLGFAELLPDLSQITPAAVSRTVGNLVAYPGMAKDDSMIASLSTNNRIVPLPDSAGQREQIFLPTPPPLGDSSLECRRPYTVPEHSTLPGPSGTDSRWKDDPAVRWDFCGALRSFDSAAPPAGAFNG